MCHSVERRLAVPDCCRGHAGCERSREDAEVGERESACWVSGGSEALVERVLAAVADM